VFTENVCYTTAHVAPRCSAERFIRVIFAGYSTRGKTEGRGFRVENVNKRLYNRWSERLLSITAAVSTMATKLSPARLSTA